MKERGNEMKRPVVLVHGAWHGAWSFQRVIEALSQQDVDVCAVDLPLRGAAGDIAAARECIEQQPGAVVLGHSYGGLVISHATAGLDVAHLVYLAALMPDEGEDIAAKIENAPPATALNNAMVVQNDGLIAIDPALGIEAFYDDCERQDAQDAVSRLRPQLIDGFPALECAPPWKSVPSTYVICRDDRALHPDLQRDFSRRAANVVEWDGAHSPFLARPGQVVELLMGLAG